MRLITTHFRPDHIGLNGWQSERFELPLPISPTTHLSCLNIPLNPVAFDTKRYRYFHALWAEDVERAHQAEVSSCTLNKRSASVHTRRGSQFAERARS
jgi:glyoxylase-like metal-dependent hydrolase (beta-lactamase superfamily II)